MVADNAELQEKDKLFEWGYLIITSSRTLFRKFDIVDVGITPHGVIGRKYNVLGVHSVRVGCNPIFIVLHI